MVDPTSQDIKSSPPVVTLHITAPPEEGLETLPIEILPPPGSDVAVPASSVPITLTPVEDLPPPPPPEPPTSQTGLQAPGLLTVPGAPAAMSPAEAEMGDIILEEEDIDLREWQRERQGSKGGFLNEVSMIIRDTTKLAAPPPIASKDLPWYTRWMNNSYAKKALFVVPLASGSLIVLYSNMGTALGLSLGGGIWGTFMAYAGAIPLTAVCSLFVRKPCRAGIQNLKVHIAASKLNLFALIGGLLGVCFSVASMYIPNIIGFGPFFIFGIVGQVLSSLIIDATGICWSTKSQIGWLFMLGEFAVVGGALLFQMKAFMDMNDPTATDAGDPDISIGIKVACLFLTMLAGSCEVWQSAVNSRLAFITGSTMRVTMYSFSSGIIILCICSFAIQPHPMFYSIDKSDWWQFMGGPVAVVGLLANTIMPKFLGFAVTFCWFVAGQLIASVCFDNFGVLGTAVVPADAFRISGVCVVGLGVLCIQIAKLWSPVQPDSVARRDFTMSPSIWYAVSNVEPVPDDQSASMSKSSMSKSFVGPSARARSKARVSAASGDISQFQKPVFMPSL